MSVDPLAREFPWQSPFMSFDGNPINKIDPTGMSADWVEKTHEDGSKSVEPDVNVTSADDPDLKTGDKYLGKQGYGINEETGNLTSYNSDGTQSDAGSILLDDVNVTDGSVQASSRGGGLPWISHPRFESHGTVGKSSIDNLRIRVTEFDAKFDKGVYAKDDPSNKAARSLLKGVSKTLPPTSVLISGSTIATGQDQFNGQNVYGFDRWGTPAIDILFNAPGVPFKLVLFWNLMNNPGAPTPVSPKQ